MNSLEQLVLLYNPMSGALSATALPSTIKFVSISGTQLSGSLPSAWSTLPDFSCLLLHDAPNLCSAIPDGLPCLHTIGTQLGEWSLLLP